MTSGATLSEMLAGLANVDARNDRCIGAVTLDSRRVEPGALFVALPGLRHDGRAFIADAIARGAAAIAYDTDKFEPPPMSVPAYGIAQLATHASAIADRFYGAPSRHLVVIGVTGTNGKTTCTQLLAQALDETESRASALGSSPSPRGRGSEGEGSSPHPLPSGRSRLPVSRDPRASLRVAAGRGGVGESRHVDRPRRCAVIGTLGYGFPDAIDPGTHTTPDAIATQRMLADSLAGGAAYATMEVSSHALEQGRVEAVAFAVAVFTNLTRDHLDYHGDMESYAAAKTRLFERDGLTAAVINRDDVYGRELIVRLGGRTRVITYGLSSGDIHALALDCAPDGLRVRAMTPRGELGIATPLLGRFNAYNLLAALATLLALGFEPDECARRLSNLRPVPGRVERFQAANHRPLIVVDYAHTPDALEQVLQALRPHVTGKLWCVFGCGGDRDPGKRPQMGAIAERLADHVILTDDNPRTESGDAIVRNIAAGMRSRARVIRDRRTAIATALSEASTADVVLVAGKGHEDYQQVGDTRYPYSDRDTVRALLGLAA